jgi:hypothetical protein
VIDPANGNLLVASANNNRLVEITPCGKVVASLNLASTSQPERSSAWPSARTPQASWSSTTATATRIPSTNWCCKRTTTGG